MANLKEILTTLLAATLKNHSLRLRLTAFRRYFYIIQQLFRRGYSRGCIFTPVRLVLFTTVCSDCLLGYLCNPCCMHVGIEVKYNMAE